MGNTIVKYGIYGFFTGFILFLLVSWLGDQMDVSFRQIISYVTFFVVLSFVYFAIKYYRDNVNNGKIRFGKALGIGILISVFAGIGTGIADYIYTSVINPDFFINYAKTIEDQERKEEILTIGSGLAALYVIILTVIIGLAISLISGLVLQRKK